MEQRDVIVVGSGPGGIAAAIKSAQLGKRVTLIERDEVGGTCLNRGCIPTKSFLHSGELYAEAKRAELFGVKIEGVSIDMAAVRSRATDVVSTLQNGTQGLIDAHGVELVRGDARILPGPAVRVQPTEGEAYILEARDVVIATGSQPACPPIPGMDTPGVYTSDTLLAQMPALNSLVVIGGGVIGVEFACGYAQTGTRVTVLEAQPRILSTLDRDLGQSLSFSLRQRGCSFAAGVTVTKIERGGEGLTVTYEKKGQELMATGEAVLVAAGRVSDVGALCAEGLELACERGRVVVDERHRTSCEHIYAIGDCVAGHIQLAHVATAEGIAAACAIVGEPCDINLSCIPSCLYTVPEIASVGLSEAEAKAAGRTVCVGKCLMAGNAKTVISGLERGFMKIVADEDGHVLGAHLCCGRATDLIGELATAVACGLSVEQMASVVRAHPTFDEAVGEAFDALLGGSIFAAPKRKR